MHDIHHHLLFGLDDGPPNLETSIAMAQIASADGITHVVCTPHANSMFAYDTALNAERLATLREALAAASIPITLGLGCDFHLSYDNIRDALANPTKYSINAKTYLLVELPDFGLPPTLTDTFYQFQIAGITPVLTHPERNPTLQRDTARLTDWLRNGLLVQVTAGSVLGHMGREAEQMSHRLLADRWVHFLATDAHNTAGRPPEMRAAHDLVARRYGASYANLLCIENPRNVFDGTPLGAQETPRKLFDDSEEEKNWWQRLLNR